MDQKNLFLALTLSLLVLFGWQTYMDWAYPPVEQPTQENEAIEPKEPNLPRPDLTLGPGIAAPSEIQSRAHVLAKSERITVDAPRVRGSINLMGSRIDDIVLVNYRETVEHDSREIHLLSPQGTTNPYFAEFGWVDSTGRRYGSADDQWRSNSTLLDSTAPVRLTWESDTGVVFRREFAIDANYMFTITDHVENRGTAPVTLFPYGRVRRVGTPEILDFYILHEGPMGVFDGTLAEVDYDDLREDGRITHSSTGGWIGITDKYWLAAIIPDQREEVESKFLYSTDGRDNYQADYLGKAKALPVGAVISYTSRFFAGAKQARLMDHYRDELGIDRFDLAIDFGWFFYITKPIFYALLFFTDILGNFGLAILALTVLIKLAFFPLANKSYTSMSRMKVLQPQMTELRERYPNDKQKMQQELMALYKREKVNPVSGCLPIALQIPVFFALYKVLFVTIEMRHAPFYGWIRDLSAPDPTTLFNLFGLIPWDPPWSFALGVWPLIMGATMFLQQKMNPQPADPIQAKMFMLMPIFFVFILAGFPAGLVIYWAWNNILSVAQQYVIMRRMGVPIGSNTTPPPSSTTTHSVKSVGNGARAKSAPAKGDGTRHSAKKRPKKTGSGRHKKGVSRGHNETNNGTSKRGAPS